MLKDLVGFLGDCREEGASVCRSLSMSRRVLLLRGGGLLTGVPSSILGVLFAFAPPPPPPPPKASLTAAGASSLTTWASGPGPGLRPLSRQQGMVEGEFRV